MNNKPLISYILPTYQAASFIRNTMNRFSEYCSDSGLSSEIIIVNDGSTDSTDKIIKNYLQENKNRSIKYINHTKNSGKGSAIKTGIQAAEGQYIVFTDCDLQYSFKNIRDVVNNLLNNNFNVVIASRMHKESIYTIRSSNLSWIYIRHTSGRIYNYLINVFTNLYIEDTQAGLKGFDAETAKLIFDKMTIKGFGFDVDVLVCAKVNNKKITSIPVEFNYEHEMSTINFIRQTFVMTFDLLRIFFKRVTGHYRMKTTCNCTVEP
ncbi:MAG: glycosyltransferase [Candidatus Omnitrophica bacterium]|nr:glycosyltransferase [Candidatus Omnitrophota bacterium]